MNVKLNTVSIIIIILFFSVISLLTLIPKHDEVVNHLPTLLTFHETNIFYAMQSDNYLGANTPLPYIIIAFLCKLFHVTPSLFIARLAGILIASLTIFIVLRFISFVPIKDYFLLILCFLFYPYFLKPAFTFYLAIYGLLFFILTLLFLNKQNLRSIFFGGIFNSLAILCQQFYLVVPIWFLYKLFIDYKNGNDLKYISKRFFLFFLPLLLPLLLFVKWGGISNKNFPEHTVSFSFISLTNVTAILAILGGLFFPLIFEKMSKIKFKLALIFFIVALLLTIYASPHWHLVGGKGMISGYTYKVINTIITYIPTFAFILELILIFFGLLTLFLLYTKRNENKIINDYYILIIILIAGFIPFGMLSERHLLHLIFLVFLIVFYKIRYRSTKLVILAYQIILGSIYFYYWVLTKTIS